MIEKTKLCHTKSKYRISCEQIKPISEFRMQGRKNQPKAYPHSICKECERTSSRLFGNTDQGRNSRYLRRFGISLAQYNELFEKQSGKCAICRCAPDDDRNNGNQHFAIDHEHNEKKTIRGLLCLTCNRGIGMLGDTHAAISRAEEYLRKPRWDVIGKLIREHNDT